MTALARKLETIREKGGMKNFDVAFLLGTRPETVSRWNKGRAYPHGSTEKALLELEYIVDQLSDFYTPNEARHFVFSRQRVLDDQSPADLIKVGAMDQVLQLIGQMRDGVFI